MSSQALNGWDGPRAARLNELFAAHAQVGGTAAGRRWETEQINWALVLRLAAEFQGFAKELHTVCAETMAEWTASGNPRVINVLVGGLTLNRELDRRNAQPVSLAVDFRRFGIDLWLALRTRYVHTVRRQTQLSRLNEARNAIVHD